METVRKGKGDMVRPDIAVVGLGFMVVTACAQPAEETANPPPPPAALPTDVDAASVEAGRMMAEAYCAACHSVGIDDESPHLDAPKFRDIAKQYPVEALAEALAEGIVVGHPDMPEFVFEPDEIDHLLDYLISIQSTRLG